MCSTVQQQTFPFPPGLEKINKISGLRFLKPWAETVHEFLDRVKFPKHKSEVKSLIHDGSIAITPFLLQNRFTTDNVFRGCHCAYLRVSNSSMLIEDVSRLLQFGVRNFSINVSQSKVSCSELYRLLLNSATSIDEHISFTFWIDYHVLHALNCLEECKNNTHFEVNEKRQLTIGILLPFCFIKYVQERKKWKFLDTKEHEHVSVLSLKHGQNFETLYNSLSSNETKFAYAVDFLLKLLAYDSTFSKIKLLAYNRDMCYTEYDNHYNRVHDEDNCCFPNHLGEVPMECQDDEIIVKFTAFLNLEKIEINVEDISKTTDLAYLLLKNILDMISVNQKWLPFLQKCSLRTAVGLIGHSEKLNHQITYWDIERLGIISSKAPFKLYPMTGFLAATLWNVSEGLWPNLIPFRRYEGEVFLSRRFSDWLQSLNNDQSSASNILKSAFEFMNHVISEHKKRNINTLVHYQMEMIRKISISFFSPTSMPVIITHEDAKIFYDEKKWISLLVDTLVQNFACNSIVLLPEIRTSHYQEEFLKCTTKKRKYESRSTSWLLKGFIDGLQFWASYSHPATKFARTVIAELLRKHMDHFST